MNRNLLDQQIPKSILSIGRQTTIVLAMAISAVAFIIIFRPFRIFESLDFMINTTNLRFINSSEDAFYLALASVVILKKFSAIVDMKIVARAFLTFMLMFIIA